jgi:hypothetical protein
MIVSQFDLRVCRGSSRTRPTRAALRSGIEHGFVDVQKPAVEDDVA